jgi:N-acetylmuramoyl-L-alanine amidase
MKVAKYYLAGDVHVVEIPVAGFAIKLMDKGKRDCGQDVVNAGFFANYKEQGEVFTLPVGHLVCDYEAESIWTRFYCEQRGSFDGDKFTFDSSKWQYNNHLYGKAVSTLVIRDGKASIQDLDAITACDYAIAGIPIMRDGKDVKFATYVKGQGWDASPLYGTWHTFLGLKKTDDKVYVIGMKTTTRNMITSAEAFQEFQGLGFQDVIKLDGGGSFYLNAAGNTVSTPDNRRINTVISFNTQGEEDSDDSTKGAESKLFKIALGAGHGIGTSGKRCLRALDSKETREWWLNDRVCDYIESELKNYEGYSILRLDDSDDGAEDVPLTIRTNEANEWGADFYLSVHHNAGANGTAAGGIVAYTHPKASAKSVEWRNDLYDALIKGTGLKGNRSKPKATADFQVLRQTKMPAVLLELGFMDSKTDVPIILTDDYARKCARAIVEVIVAKAGLTKKAEPENGVLYKVQVGAFSKKANAEKLQKELISKGYTAYIIRL